METRNMKSLELICLIVNFGLGSKVIKTAKQFGVTGGTIFLGKGTVRNHILELLDITDIRKEIVMMIAEKSVADTALMELDKKFELVKPNHGIAFTMTVAEIYGSRTCQCDKHRESKGGGTMYNSIFVVVDKGLAGSVIDAAGTAGSKGGTIINARGSGVNENQKIFSMVIEPEKEIVLILSEIEKTDAIVDAIRKELEIDESGRGIIFVLDVNKTFGLY